MKLINNVVFFLTILLLVSFVSGVLVRVTPMPNINLYTQDLVAGAIFALTLFFYVRQKGFSELLFPIIFFNIAAIISLILNIRVLEFNELLISGSYLLRLDFYLSLLFLGRIGFSNHKIQILRKIFVFSSLMMVFLGFVQFLFYNNLRNLYYLGWDEHLYRLFSTFLDPNFAGLFYALLGLFLIAELFRVKNYKYSNFGFLVVTFLALLLTYSRTALIAFTLGIGSYFVLSKRYKLLFVTFFIIVVGVLSVSNFAIEGMNPIRIASSEARIQSAERALEIFSEKPVFGVGFNAYRYAQIDKGFVDPEKTELSNADAGTDNSLLFVLATVGIVGLIFYLNMWRRILIEVNNNKKMRVAGISIIATFFAGSLFINGLFYAPLMLWVFCYLGLFVLSKKTNSRT